MKILIMFLLLTFGACELVEDSLGSLSGGSGYETDTDNGGTTNPDTGNGGDTSEGVDSFGDGAASLPVPTTDVEKANQLMIDDKTLTFKIGSSSSALVVTLNKVSNQQ